MNNLDLNQIAFSIQNTLRPETDSFGIAFLGIRWYAIFVILGFLVAIMIVCFRARTHYKMNYDFLYYFAIIVLPVSILGARFWSACIGDLQWGNFFNFSSGGLAIQGGLVFTAIAAFIYFPLMLKKPKYQIRIKEENNVYIRKPSLWVVLDLIAPAVLIGQAIGRWGNFFNGEIFGQEVDPSQLEWLKIIMPGVFDKMQFILGSGNTIGEGLIDKAYYQPLFLYESFINTFCFAILYFIIPNIKKIRIGVIGSSYFVIYGIIRFALEPIRYNVYNFTGTYILNGILMIMGLILVINCQFICPKFRKRRMLFSLYCKYFRINYIKLLKKIKPNRYLKFINVDPKLENYGFNKKIILDRKPEDYLYYGPTDDLY